MGSNSHNSDSKHIENSYLPCSSLSLSSLCVASRVVVCINKEMMLCLVHQWQQQKKNMVSLASVVLGCTILSLKINQISETTKNSYKKYMNPTRSCHYNVVIHTLTGVSNR
jgi:hypothetical protein